MLAVGLCGSDRHWYEDGAIGEVRLAEPVVLGHEIVARIAAGPRRGERVAVDPAVPCGTCDICRSGRGRLCRAVRFAGHAPDDGGLRTQMAWPSDRLHLLPELIGDAEGTLLEVLGIALHALDLAGLPAEGSSREPGRPDAHRLIARASVPASTEPGRSGSCWWRHSGRPASTRLSRATRSGIALTPRESLARDGSCPGDRDARSRSRDSRSTSRSSAPARTPRSTRPFVRFGPVAASCWSASQRLRRLAFPAAVARRKELSLHLCRRMEASDLPRAIGLVAVGRVDVRPFVSHRFALDEAGEAFRVLADRSGLKVVVEPQREARA